MTVFHPQTPRKCPPQDARPTDGIYYRVVFNNPPVSEDFVIWVLEPENHHMLEEKRRKKDCCSFAISMLTEEGTLRSGLFLRGMKKKAEKRKAGFLGWAQVRLNPDSGVLKQTGQNPHHHDLWPYINCKLECNVISVKGI